MTAHQKIAGIPKGLISAIEIAYFRSFYKAYFEPLSGLNIFFGENDTGKSNIMRALNLFFNGVVEEGYGFDFDVDLSTRRLKDASAGVDVRKFVYVKIWFRTPAVHRQALGEEFYVKRTWSQLTEGFRQEVSRNINTPGKQQSLTKFLGKVGFTYIPAVKDRSIYDNLLIDAYGAIASAAQFSAALNAFTMEIRNQTTELTDRLRLSLEMSSEIAPPTDLGELFGSLDFQTLVAGGDQMSLIRQRGDGVQARHIPEILSFIADRDTKPYHIWAVEEPENSLSIVSALKLAERLKQISHGPSVQIFLTTHSPAFYSVIGSDVRKFFIRKTDDQADVEILYGTSASPAQLMEFMGDTFYLPLVAESVREAARAAEELRASLATLQAKANAQNKPLLFVEGDSDQLLITHLLERRGRETADRLDVISLGGTSHAGKIGVMTGELIARLLHGRLGFVLLDSDHAGQTALPSSVSRTGVRTAWLAGANKIMWRVLSPTSEAADAFSAAGLSDPFLAGVCLEDCYSAETRAEAMAKNSYGLGEPRPFTHTKADLFSISPALNHPNHRFYLLAPDKSRKTKFIRWLIDSGRASCETIENLLDDLLLAIDADLVKNSP